MGYEVLSQNITQFVELVGVVDLTVAPDNGFVCFSGHVYVLLSNWNELITSLAEAEVQDHTRRRSDLLW
jgi:hypothetical protein